MISYGEFLWVNLIGISFGVFLLGFQIGWAGKTGLGSMGWAGLGRPGQGWPGLAWDVMGFQSTVENPDKISQ